MSSPPRQFDVWFVAANTVYKGVPYQVVADWAQQGRLAAADMLRPAGSSVAWQAVQQWELFADYLPRPAVATVPAASDEPAEIAEPVEDDYRPRRRKADDDDDVDMIPLIDISMVLLVFFIMMRAAGALSPVDVPDMRYAGELRADADAITISIEKSPEDRDKVTYSVRVGPNAPLPENAALPTPEAAIAALDLLLAEAPRPPEVRIACEKDLPSERVFELNRDLKKRFERGLINNSVATVNEAPKPE